MKSLRKLLSHLPLLFAMFFLVNAVASLITQQLGIGLMNLVFAVYFMFDYKSSKLEQRIRTLEIIEGMRMAAAMELANQRAESQEPPTGMSQ